MNKFLGLVLALALLIPATAQATITVGGYQFYDNAFADSFTASSGTYNTAGGTLAQVLTDKNAGDVCLFFTSGAFVTLAFTDQNLVNGQGNDLAIFELGIPDTLKVKIGNTTLNYATVDTGFDQLAANGMTYNLNVALVDLTAFGVPFGGIRNVITLGMDMVNSTSCSVRTVPSLSLVGDLNSSPPAVPIPGTLLLLSSGVLGMVGLRLQRNR